MSIGYVLLQVVFLYPTSSCHTALNSSPTENAKDAQIAARLTALLSRKIRSQPTWGLSFPSFLSNASNVGYLPSLSPPCLLLSSGTDNYFLVAISSILVCFRLGGPEGSISQ